MHQVPFNCFCWWYLHLFCWNGFGCDRNFGTFQVNIFNYFLQISLVLYYLSVKNTQPVWSMLSVIFLFGCMCIKAFPLFFFSGFSFFYCISFFFCCIFPFFITNFIGWICVRVEKLSSLWAQTCAIDTVYAHPPDICSISVLDLHTDMQLILPMIICNNWIWSMTVLSLQRDVIALLFTSSSKFLVFSPTGQEK